MYQVVIGSSYSRGQYDGTVTSPFVVTNAIANTREDGVKLSHLSRDYEPPRRGRRRIDILVTGDQMGYSSKGSDLIYGSDRACSEALYELRDGVYRLKGHHQENLGGVVLCTQDIGTIDTLTDRGLVCLQKPIQREQVVETLCQAVQQYGL